MSLLPEWQQIVEYYFDERITSTMDRIARLCGLVEYAPLEPQRYRIYDGLGLPITCRICGGNAWVHSEGEFVCAHENDEEYVLVPMAVRDEKQMSEVTRYEVVE